MSYKFYLGGGKCYSTSFKGCHFPSNIHLLPYQRPSSWIPSELSRNYGLEHAKRHNFTFSLSSNGVKTRVLPLSFGLADAAATISSKPVVDISVLIQTSALLLFMYILANFIVPQIIISGKFDEEEENN